MMVKNIWLINHYALRNNGRHANLAMNFKKDGCEVSVFLSSYDHQIHQYLYAEEIKIVRNQDGVNYVYIHSKPSYKGNGLSRILNMISFCWIIWQNKKQIVKEIGCPSHIIGSSVHPFVWEVGFYLAKRYSAKFIAEVRDLWPLSLIEIQHVSKKHPLVRLLSLIERRAYKRSDAIVTTMPYAYQYICDKFSLPREKVSWMPNGIEAEAYDQNLQGKEELPDDLNEFLNNHWCCVYTGSLVASECIPMMLEAFKILRQEDVYFAIIGDGHDADQLKEMKDEMCLEKVSFFPFVKQSLIPKILDKAKCCIGAINDYPLYRYGLSLNKLNDYLYSGKPVIFACNYHNVVNDADQFCIPSSNPSLLADTIKQIKTLKPEQLAVLSEKSRDIIKKQYDYAAITQQYLRLLDTL